MYMFNPFNIVFPEFIHGNYKFRMIVFYLN